MLPIFIAAGVLLFFFIFLILFMVKSYQKVQQGKAIIRSGMGGTMVSFSNGIYAFPLLHRTEEMDISIQKLEVSCKNEAALRCKDNQRAAVKAVFYIGVNHTADDIIAVAQNIGSQRASSPKVLAELFYGKFAEALQFAAKEFTFVQLYQEPSQFKDIVLQYLGSDLMGFRLHDLAIQHFEAA